MKSILKTCKPRADIVSGTFNPEIFTASLSHVVNHYRGKPGIANSIYTDGMQFFKDATYPTEGLKLLLADVFGRLAGDNALPSIHRLETAFGGGKTHALIAITHLAFRGKELAPAVIDIIPGDIVPDSDEVCIVGIAGDELPVHKPQGTGLVPYTIWGEMAFQIGGKALYNKVKNDAISYAAPGKNYFDTVFVGKKVIVMMDELAQYATRFQAVRHDGGDLLAAFLMGLFGYARNNGNIAIVVSLAGSTDAFANQTEIIANLISKVRGEEVDEEAALGIAQQAENSLRSVVARDATTIVPVQATEISHVLAKRLFDDIDTSSAEKTADEYMMMYRTHSSSLPDTAIREAYRDIMVAHYPFHPTFLRFLNEKMSTIETFQGTRGVLRVLTLVVRNLWDGNSFTAMIHTCHLNLQDVKTINEVLGRTGGGDLLPVINTDIGGPDSSSLSVGQSYAQMADKKNPHPEGYPLYEFTWKTVFLHSLVGRSQMFESNIFGITEQDALFSISCPGLTPPQVQTALKEIDNSAQYLRFNQGRYYASLEPSINRALTTIRGGLRKEDVDDLLIATARKIVKDESSIFQVVHDVYDPANIADSSNKPLLGLVAINADDITAEEFVTSIGQNRPRINQNLVFLLVPKTVHEKTITWNNDQLDSARESLNRMTNLAKDVMARKKLKMQPENYGMTETKLIEQSFDSTSREREMALLTTISQSYDSVWYPSSTGNVIRKEINTSGGEGGTSVIAEIKKTLDAEGELVSSDAATTLETVSSLEKLFFEKEETPYLADIRDHFCCKRHWPVLESVSLLDQIIRKGITTGHWCLFRIINSENTSPDDFYSRDTDDLPFDVDLSDEGWSLIKIQGAKKRGWGPQKVDIEKIKDILNHTVAKAGVETVDTIISDVRENYGDVPDETVKDLMNKLIQDGNIASFNGEPEQNEKPSDLTYGRHAGITILKPETVIATPATIAKRGWIEETPDKFELSGPEGAKRFIPILSQIGSLYNRGAKSKINVLDMFDLKVPNGGLVRITLEDVTPEGMKQLGEFFEILSEVVESDDETGVDITVDEPYEDCLFIKELKK